MRSMLTLPLLLAAAVAAQDKTTVRPHVLQLGARGDDRGYAVAAAPDGGFVLAGAFSEKVNFGTGGPDVELVSQVGGSGDGRDAFVAAYGAGFKCRWAVSFGGPRYDGCHAVAVDAKGNVFVAGKFQGDVDFDPGPKDQTRTAARQSGFLLSLDRDGGFRWVHTMPIDWPDVVADPAGNVFLVATHLGPDENGRSSPSVGVTMYRSDGEQVWAKTFESAVRPAVAAMPDGGVAVAMFAGSPRDPAKGRVRLLALAPSGDVRREIVLDGYCAWARGLAVGPDGTTYLAGAALSSWKLDLDPGPEQRHVAGETEHALMGFVARYDAKGRLLGAFEIGGSVPPDIAVTASGDVIAAGMTVRGSIQPGAEREIGLAVVRWSPTGDAVWRYPITVDAPPRTNNDPVAHQVAIDGRGRLLVVGRFGDKLELPDGRTLESAGNHDVLLLRFDG